MFFCKTKTTYLFLSPFTQLLISNKLDRMHKNVSDKFSQSGCIFHVWNGEPLGFTIGLKWSEYNTLPHRRRVVIRRVDSRRNPLRVGDVLDAIGDSPVPSELSHSREIYSLIYGLEPPVILRFYSCSKDVIYQQQAIMLTQFRLGIVLSDHLYNNKRIPIVTCVQDVQNCGSNAAQPGDILVKVCGMHAITMTLDTIKKIVEDSARPIGLCFARIKRTKSCPISQFKKRNSLFTSSGLISEDVRCRSISYCDRKSYSTNLDKLEYTSIIDDEEFHTTFNESRDILICWEYGNLGVSLKASSTGNFPVVNRLTGKGTPRGINQLQYGDELFAVNEKSVAGAKVRELWRVLLKIAKPVVLRFKKKDDDTHAIWKDNMYEQNRRHYPLLHSNDRCYQNGTSSDSLDDSVTDSRISNPLISIDHEDTDDDSEWEDAAKVFVHRIRVRNHLVSYELTWNDGPLGLRLRDYDQPPQGRVILIEEILQHSIIAQLGCVKVGDKLASINGLKIKQNTLIIGKLDKICKISKPVILGFVRKAESIYCETYVT